MLVTCYSSEKIVEKSQQTRILFITSSYLQFFVLSNVLLVLVRFRIWYSIHTDSMFFYLVQKLLLHSSHFSCSQCVALRYHGNNVHFVTQVLHEFYVDRSKTAKQILQLIPLLLKKRCKRKPLIPLLLKINSTILQLIPLFLKKRSKSVNDSLLCGIELRKMLDAAL